MGFGGTLDRFESDNLKLNNICSNNIHGEPSPFKPFEVSRNYWW